MSIKKLCIRIEMFAVIAMWAGVFWHFMNPVSEVPWGIWILFCGTGMGTTFVTMAVMWAERVGKKIEP